MTNVDGVQAPFRELKGAWRWKEMVVIHGEEFLLNMSDSNNGIYIIQLLSKSGSSYFSKNVKKMKKLLLLLMLTISPSLFMSQALGIPESEWFYNYGGYGVSGGYVHIDYVQDTVINDTLAYYCQSTIVSSFMDGAIGTFESQPIIYYANEDQVFRYIDGNFKLFYDLSADVGDTLLTYSVQEYVLPPECDNTGYSIIDSVGTFSIDGQTLRYLYLSDGEESNTIFNGYIIERIGSLQGFPFGYTSFEDGCSLIIDGQHTGALRCYNDFQIEYDNPSNTNPCTFVVGIEELSQLTFEVYPNPSNDIFNIELLESKVLEVVVYNLVGEIIFREDKIRTEEYKLNLKNQPVGIYTVKLSDEEGGSYVSKIVLE